MSKHTDRVTGWLSLWLIAAVVWGFISGMAREVLTVTGIAIVVYAVAAAVFERRDRKRNQEK